MYIKPSFDLIYGKKGDQIYNIVPLSKSTLSAYEVDSDEFFYLKNLVKMHIKSKNEVGNEYVLKNLDRIFVVRLDTYPLPGFVSKDGYGYINISAMPSSNISDFSTTDIYALYLYTTVLRSFIVSQSIPADSDELISTFLFSIFMKMYRKKAGLTGAYRTLIPKLAFIIWVYVYIGMMGNKDTESARRKIAGNLYTDFNDLKTDYNFSSISDVLKCLNENNIITTSTNNFSTQVINYGGIVSLPIFEDASRFFATLIATTVPGSKLFSSYWAKVRPDLFKKVVSKGLMFLSRSK